MIAASCVGEQPFARQRNQDRKLKVWQGLVFLHPSKPAVASTLLKHSHTALVRWLKATSSSVFDSGLFAEPPLVTYHRGGPIVSTLRIVRRGESFGWPAFPLPPYSIHCYPIYYPILVASYLGLASRRTSHEGQTGGGGVPMKPTCRPYPTYDNLFRTVRGCIRLSTREVQRCIENHALRFGQVRA